MSSLPSDASPQAASSPLKTVLLVVGGLAAVGLVYVLLVRPAMLARDEARNRVESINNMKQILLAALYYESMTRSLPSDVISKDGKPLLSWRVKLLPMLEQQSLFNQFKFDEPWDSPHNLALAEEMPWVFASPKVAGKAKKTVYLAPRGEGTMHGGMHKGEPVEAWKKGMILDGASNTILVLEADEEQAVPWTKPADLEVDPAQPRRGVGKLRDGPFLAGFVDGSVRAIEKDVPDKEVARLYTPSGRD